MPDTPAGASRLPGWSRWAAGTVLAGIVLMLCYLRTAGTVPVLSDGAGNALQAWDMLHGNLLLHGWWVTDVSFYTTELPQFMLVEVVAGLRPEVVHICAAMTYTLLVLLAAFAARGRARGAEGVVRALLAAGIMLAPQPGAPTWILMSSPDHVGTAVPLLVLLLLLDFAPRRWWVPVAAGVILAWTTVGDEIALAVGVAPLALVCLLWAGRVLASSRGGLRAAWYELSLAAAAIVSVPVALAADRVLRHLGGFSTNKGVSSLVPLPVMSGNLPLWARSILAVFGADYPDASGRLHVAVALVHLVGVALVAAAVLAAVWGLLRSLVTRPAGPTGSRDGSASGDLTADFLVVAVVANLVAYLVMFHINNIYAAHEIGPVLSLGAALVGRILGGPLLRARLGRRRRGAGPAPLVPVLAVGLACYAAMLGYAATRAQAAPANSTLATWLDQHDLHSGLAGYWEGTVVTLESGDRIDMVSVVPGVGGRLVPRHWEADMRLTDARDHAANFVVVAPDAPFTRAQAVRTFGRPARVYHLPGYTVLVWDKNLLRQLGQPVS
jgi:hypothetical protein